VSKPSSNWTACCYPAGFFSCASLLVGGTVAFFTLIAPIVFWLQGLNGIVEALTAVLICLFSGLSALAVSLLPVSRQQPLVGLLLAMALRVLPPLVVCLLLAKRGSGTDSLGFIIYLIVFYLLTLAAETFLSLRLMKNQNR